MFGNWFRPHGYNIGYHPVLIDWVRHLNKHYEELEEQQIEDCIVHINNCISHDMQWKNVYNIDYNPQNQMFTLHGFPKHGFPEFFNVSSSQMRWTLNRMGYNHARIHLKHRNVKFIELFFDENIDEIEGSIVEFVEVEDDDESLDLPDVEFPPNPCNVLTPDGYDERGLLDL